MHSAVEIETPTDWILCFSSQSKGEISCLTDFLAGYPVTLVSILARPIRWSTSRIRELCCANHPSSQFKPEQIKSWQLATKRSECSVALLLTSSLFDR